MALCTSGQKTTIKWQYSGEEKQEIIGADNYTVNQKPAQCPNTDYYFQGWELSPAPGQDENTPLYRQSVEPITFLYLQKIPYPIVDYELLNSQQQVISYAQYKQNGRKFNAAYSLAVYVNYNSANPRFLYYYYGFLNNWGLEPNKFVRIDGQPDNCGNCTFKVTKNNQVVYQKTRPTCPTVTHFCGEQCPAGSCECNCGTRVCCHHPTTGAVVKSFTR
jgi:hypothetical protein